MKRVLLVAVLGLVAGGGCKKSPVPTAPADMVRTSPDGMLSPDGRGVVTGGEVEVAGLIKAVQEDGGRLVVTFASKQPTRSVLCRVEAGQAAAAGNLAAGQLVAMHGLARGQSGGNPVLEPCRVVWAGPPPGTKPADGRDVSRAARSLEMCRVPLLVDGLRRGGRTLPDGKPMTEAAFRQQEPARAERLDAAEKKARAELASGGLTALSCDHPLLHVLQRCETASGPDSPGVECDAPYVREILSLLTR
ncbi:hypothetical protein F0U62_11835 [Cystobacter fuscus]|uniref:hypothetical protein n=1 Tax=Cystobacter fuscus TaxID=43 RepID=UPI002B2DB39B|nr:hypothetical protein F0U62_11835 [Cystobacter fuscus]